MLHQIHPNKIRQVFFLTVLILLAIIIGKELYFMFAAFLGAITMHILLRTLMFKLVFKYHWKRWYAALTLVFGTLIIFVLPLIWLISILINKAIPILNNPELINSTANTLHEYILQRFNLDIFNTSNISKVNAQLLPMIKNMVGGTLSSVGSLFIMYFILYFMLTSAHEMEIWLKKNVPFKHSNADRLIKDFRNLVYSNAIGIPLVAIVQGLAGLIGYLIFGVREFVFMGILTAICSVIPVLGSMIVYLPLAIYQLAIGHTWQGIGILIWGFVIIGTIDNVARLLIQKRISDVHPLITIFGVIIGISLFGFIGIIFGPLLLSMFVLLVKIYIDEFGRVEAEEPEKLV